MAHHQIFKQSFDPNIDFSGLCQLQIDEDFDIHSSINSILGNELVMNGEVMMKEDHDDDDKERKRKAAEMMTSTTCSSYSSPQRNPNKRRGRGKKGRGKEEEEEEEEKDAGEVIHVRAKRGQATDSHSLAERVRRGKINERLRCLQDIVPGCYKTMSMAVMLDEIINYVQSLQNQVEFLSMKLTSASSFHDFNADADAIEAMQRANAFEAIKGANEELPSDSAQLPHNFAYYPQSHTTSGFIN